MHSWCLNEFWQTGLHHPSSLPVKNHGYYSLRLPLEVASHGNFCILGGRKNTVCRGAYLSTLWEKQRSSIAYHALLCHLVIRSNFWVTICHDIRLWRHSPLRRYPSLERFDTDPRGCFNLVEYSTTQIDREDQSPPSKVLDSSIGGLLSWRRYWLMGDGRRRRHIKYAN